MKTSKHDTGANQQTVRTSPVSSTHYAHTREDCRKQLHRTVTSAPMKCIVQQCHDLYSLMSFLQIEH